MLGLYGDSPAPIVNQWKQKIMADGKKGHYRKAQADYLGTWVWKGKKNEIKPYRKTGWGF